MGLFQPGPVTLHSGATASFKIECNELTDTDWEVIAQLALRVCGNFRSVEPIPRGGDKLAKLLAPYAGANGSHLVVDDVLTSGESMTKALTAARHNAPWVSGFVAFARGHIPYGVRALFTLHPSAWA